VPLSESELDGEREDEVDPRGDSVPVEVWVSDADAERDCVPDAVAEREGEALSDGETVSVRLALALALSVDCTVTTVTVAELLGLSEAVVELLAEEDDETEELREAVSLALPEAETDKVTVGVPLAECDSVAETLAVDSGEAEPLIVEEALTLRSGVA
jgi:hypothetical protein